MKQNCIKKQNKRLLIKLSKTPSAYFDFIKPVILLKYLSECLFAACITVKVASHLLHSVASSSQSMCSLGEGGELNHVHDLEYSFTNCEHKNKFLVPIEFKESAAFQTKTAGLMSEVRIDLLEFKKKTQMRNI